MHDLVIRNGTLVDGTGGPWRQASVAIDGGRIVEVGTVGRGRREIDARDKLVTPGWVDMHTHYDGQATWDPTLSPSGWHGVTTAIMGNCGVGFAPVRQSDRDWIVGVMEGVEDIPGSALHEGIKWGWQTFPEYLDALESMPFALDVATQVPHAAVRAWVMGRDASEEDRPATADQVGVMKAIVKEALRAGALGFSTSRTSLHKTIAGKFVAGTFAHPQELAGIAEALAETGTGVLELACEHGTLHQDLDWIEEIARSTGRPAVVNLSQIDFAPTLWRSVLARIEQAQERAAPVFAQVAGRAIGILMSWQATAHPFVLHPTWQALASLPWPQRRERLKDPAVREAILSEKPIERGVFEHFVTRTFEKMFVFDESGYEPRPDQSLASAAKRLGVKPEALAYDALMARDGTGFLYFPLFNYSDGNLDVLHTLHTHPLTRMGLADGGAHCGAICDGGMPTFMLTHWTRDRTRGPKMPLEHVVRRQTQDTAAFYGLHDRGIVGPGFRADLNVIDYDALSLDAPRLVHDLPAGGRRLAQRAYGYEATVCAGQVTFVQGQPTGVMAGRLVRGAQSAPMNWRPLTPSNSSVATSEASSAGAS